MIELKKKNSFIRELVSLMLLVVFIITTGIELYKSVKKHKHNSCTETSTHYHQEHDTCSLCEFHLSSFELNLNSEFYIANNILSEKTLPIYLDIFFLSPSKRYSPRGPPRFS